MTAPNLPVVRRWVEPSIFQAVCEELAAQKRKVKRLEARNRSLTRKLALYESDESGTRTDG